MDECEICKGGGWIRRDLPYDHPEFGKLVRCECNREPDKPIGEDPRVDEWRERRDVEPVQSKIPF